MIVRRQWSALLQIAALCSTTPSRVSRSQIQDALGEFGRAARRLDGRSLRNLSAAVFGMQTVLLHLGRLEQLPTRDNGRSGGRDADWQRITERAPVLAATMSDYLDQMSVRLRPNSRATIEKSWLAARPGHRGTTWPPRPSAGGSGRWRRSSSGSTSSTSRTRRRVHRSCAPRSADQGRPSTPLHRRPSLGEAARRRPRPPRPVHPRRDRAARPHRPTSRRTTRPDHRRRRADRVLVLAARPRRQAAHRPLRSAVSPAQDPARQVADPPGAGAALGHPVPRTRPADHRLPAQHALAAVAATAGIGHVTARQLRPPCRARLPLRVGLRDLHLLRHHHRVPPHPQTPTRRRRSQGRAKGQRGREKLFEGILSRLDEPAS